MNAEKGVVGGVMYTPTVANAFRGLSEVSRRPSNRHEIIEDDHTIVQVCHSAVRAPDELGH